MRGVHLGSGWFGISDSTGWALLACYNLGAMAVLLTLCCLLLWHRGTERQRRRMASYRRWEPIFLEFLCTAAPGRREALGNRLHSVVGHRERQDFADFVLEYLGDLRGADADSLRQLLRTLGYLELAHRELGSRNPWRRARGARLLEAMRAEEATPTLVRALHDRSVVVSFVAACALVRIGGAEAGAAVADALVRRSDWNPSQIKEILLEGGQELADRLVKVLHECDPRESKTKVIVDLLGMLRHLPAAETLLALLRRQTPDELRVSILRTLGRLEYAPALKELRDAAGDASWVVRSQAVLALGRIGDRSSVPTLEAALADGEYWVRFNAALALGSLGAVGRSVLTRVAEAAHPAALEAREVLLLEGAP